MIKCGLLINDINRIGFFSQFVCAPAHESDTGLPSLVTHDVQVIILRFSMSESQPRFFRPLKIGLLSSRFSSGSQQIENSTSDKHFRQELKGVKIGVRKARNSGIRVGHVGIISRKTFALRFCYLKLLGPDY